MKKNEKIQRKVGIVPVDNILTAYDATFSPIHSLRTTITHVFAIHV